MHAAIHAREVDEVVEHAPAPVLEWIEEPDLDVGMRIERGDPGIEAGGVVVIEEQPHAHATIGGAMERLEQQRPRHIVVPDVVLHVQRMLGGTGEQHARGESVETFLEREHPRLAWMRLHHPAAGGPQPGLSIGRDAHDTESTSESRGI